MNKERLFEYVKTQNQSKLLELLSLAFDTMDTNQRHDVFGKTAKEVPPSSVDGKEILTTIEQFYEKSITGYYYAPFDINSKNFSDTPEETDAWFDEISDYLEDSSRLADQGEHEMAVQCFKLLHELIDKMEDGDEIVFADEYGTWMITGDEKRFVKSYLSSLAAISTPEVYANGAIPLIKRDSYESFHNKVYASAIKIANEDQKVLLKTDIIQINPWNRRKNGLTLIQKACAFCPVYPQHSAFAKHCLDKMERNMYNCTHENYC